MQEISSAEGFWNDPQKAGEVMKEMESLKGEIAELAELENRLRDLSEFVEMYETLSGKEQEEIWKQFENLKTDVEKMEFKSLLGGEYDRNDVILAIHSGAGGVDAQDWAEMLLRMYLRWAESKGYSAKVVDESKGSEAGIKSVTVEIEGAYAYGYLKGEAGVHRLVRLSPFNSDNLRQTSFALVEILPVIAEIKEVSINPQDLLIDTYRASGAGGQHVNTTDSAVRITHKPTGVVVTCQSERSQIQNRERAMKVLKARIHQKFLEEQEKEKKKLRGEFQSAEWGSQIRSYVLHPYKMVKDHRTKHETSEAEKVLEGNLDGFMEEYLKFNVKRP
ncbi:MAG: Peptide chain release factor RF-2 [Parcubacteria group bacterium GW2011_GWC1_45_14]|nr:MAG: Peptide chain release factor RF-2 [Candidatus Moranbacteria bacterium GW2011_GWC2_45_10]KKT94612.1 MAG: Peptide chain release factor RF-2 [Parcubacteria group bacterium GW2011_GWC1_45_14]